MDTPNPQTAKAPDPWDIGFGVLVLAGSLLAILYVWKVVERAYLAKPPEDATRAEAPASMLIPAWLLAIANLYFGFQTDLSVGVATRAAAELFGIAP